MAYSGNIFNTLLGNVSSLFIYTFPIIFLNFLYNKKKLFNLKKIIIISLLSLIIFFISYLFHDVSMMGQNGGAFFIFSNLIFKNYIAFYIIFIINLISILIIFEDKFDKLIVFSFVFIFCSMIVPQSVFEPLFFLYFFLFSKTKFKNIFLENKKVASYLLLYYIIYYLISKTDILYKISF